MTLRDSKLLSAGGIDTLKSMKRDCNAMIPSFLTSATWLQQTERPSPHFGVAAFLS